MSSLGEYVPFWSQHVKLIIPEKVFEQAKEVCLLEP
jgi:hypothetical protein